MVCRPLWSKLLTICAICVQLLIGIIMDTLKLYCIKIWCSVNGLMGNGMNMYGHV